MKCEITWCENERTCLYYCHEHHVIVCVEGNSNVSALRPIPRVPDVCRATQAVRKEKIMKQKVIRAKQSPLNKMQWHCDLACGHSEWVTSKRRPVAVECHAQQSAHPTPESGSTLPAVESNSENSAPAVSSGKAQAVGRTAQHGGIMINYFDFFTDPPSDYFPLQEMVCTGHGLLFGQCSECQSWSRPTKHAPNVVEYVASVSISPPQKYQRQKRNPSPPPRR